MTSDFISADRGRLKLTHEEFENTTGVPLEARVSIEPGKNRDGYWNATDMLNQMSERALPISKILYPRDHYEVVWLFDQSTGHAKFADDALKSSNMNMGDGGKVLPLRDGWYIGPDGEKVVQTMWYPEVDADTGETKRIPKGIKRVLQERGIWPTDKNLKLSCKASNHHEIEMTGTVNHSCCARKLMDSQPDFKEQVSMLENLVCSAGDTFLLYPKYHCELNFIEQYWGETK